MRTRSYIIASALLLAALGCGDKAESPTEPTTRSPHAGLAAATVLAFRHVSAGTRHTCGVTTTDRAYCWGYNGFSTQGGQLGDGTTESKLTPVAVAGGRRFRVVSAGNFHSCGITPANVLFCWGANRYGVMGAAAALNHTPVKVGGTRTWRNVSAGFSHTCGATTTSEAYCWGNNSNFQLGNGQASLVPQPLTKVVGGLNWRQVFVGSGFIAPSSDAPDDALSCGITTAERVFCRGSGAASSTPKQIIGARRYSQLGVGTQGCAVRLTGAIDCWTSESITRVASGTLLFQRVSVSGLRAHKCAVGTDNKAYCWGPENANGQLGTGTTNPSAKPVAVAAP